MATVNYPVNMDMVYKVHSGLIYNYIQRKPRDKYGRYGDGILCYYNGVALSGEDLWRKTNKDFPPIGTEYGCWHGAVDIVPKGGQTLPVYAIADGVVVGRATGTYGQSMMIKYEDLIQDAPIFTVHQHIKYLPELTIGTIVKAGQKIGKMAAISAVHCHFEFMTNAHLKNDSQVPYAKDFYFPYKAEHRPWSQFTKSDPAQKPDYLERGGLYFPSYCYNGIKAIEYLAGL